MWTDRAGALRPHPGRGRPDLGPPPAIEWDTSPGESARHVIGRRLDEDPGKFDWRFTDLGRPAAVAVSAVILVALADGRCSVFAGANFEERPSRRFAPSVAPIRETVQPSGRIKWSESL